MVRIGNKPNLKITGEIAQEYLKRFPNAGALTLAKKMHTENIGVFKDVEHARKIIRYYLGQSGSKNRVSLNVKTFQRGARELRNGNHQRR